MGIRKSEVLTGLFALTVVAIGVILITTADLGGGGGESTCVATFDDVNLLENGARVAVNGRPVGRVLGMRPVIVDGPDGTKVSKVEVEFTVSDDVFGDLKSSTMAQVGQESLLGAKFIKIVPSTVGGELEKDGDNYVITTKPLFDMFATLEKLAEQIDPITDNLNKVLVNLNEQVMPRISKLLDDNGPKLGDLLDNSKGLVADSREMVVGLRTRLTGPNGFMDNADKLTAELQSLLEDTKSNLAELTKSGKNTMANVDRLLVNADESLALLSNRLDQQTLPKLEKLLATADRTVASAKTDLTRLTDASIHTLGNVDNLVSDPNLYATMVQARDALREVKLLMLSLRSNPAQLIFGGPGEIEEATPAAFDATKQHKSGRGRRYDP